ADRCVADPVVRRVHRFEQEVETLLVTEVRDDPQRAAPRARVARARRLERELFGSLAPERLDRCRRRLFDAWIAGPDERKQLRNHARVTDAGQRLARERAHGGIRILQTPRDGAGVGVAAPDEWQEKT